MRVVWKDSGSRGYRPTKYRGYNLTKLGDGTWITDIPNDKYIYHNLEMTKNAADKILGGEPRKKNPKRHNMGIKIVGIKEGAEA